MVAFQTSFAADFKEQWTTSFDKSGPSCPLYRKRVADYYQRISEVDYAMRVQTENFNTAEIKRMTDLWERTSAPLLMVESATYKQTAYVGDWADIFLKSPAAVKVQVTSSLLNWESDKFIFPDEVLKVNVDPNRETISIEFKMQYAQACLQTSDLNILFTLKMADNSLVQLNLKFKLDKTKWDLIAMRGPTKEEELQEVIDSKYSDTYKLEEVAKEIEISGRPIIGADKMLQQIIDRNDYSIESTYPAVISALINTKSDIPRKEEMIQQILNSPKTNYSIFDSILDRIRYSNAAIAEKSYIVNQIYNSEKMNDCIYISLAKAILSTDGAITNSSAMMKTIIITSNKTGGLFDIANALLDSKWQGSYDSFLTVIGFSQLGYEDLRYIKDHLIITGSINNEIKKHIKELRKLLDSELDKVKNVEK